MRSMPKLNTVVESAQWSNEILSSLEMGIVVVDKNFKVEVWNDFMQNYSQKEAKEVRGKTLFEHFPEIQKSWLERKCNPVFALATPVFIIWEQRHYLFKFNTSRPVTSNAQYMYQNITITPLIDNEGKVDKLCFLVYDVTDQALSKMRIEGLNSELETISRIDGLTGLYNRRYWQERFEREFKLSSRNKSAMSLIMLDIDHFKVVNDSYGHLTGDEVIRNICDIIRNASRETDIAGRYGGEEFVILLPDTSSKNAVNVAQRIRKAVMNTIVKYEKHELRYTCSLGVAEKLAVYTKPQMWIEAADKALYAAKETGRNKVSVDAAEL
ncbi:MAG: diguanylate cyclase [Patiriisocius sp.]|jgi:diguanylate cyclase (GGDEF)-like protein